MTMQKMFCDNCNQELTKNVTCDRIVRRYNQFTLEVLVAHRGVWNNGDLCEACALKILTTGNALPAATLPELPKISES